jgi:FixJ family two-component response regulator
LLKKKINGIVLAINQNGAIGMATRKPTKPKTSAQLKEQLEAAKKRLKELEQRAYATQALLGGTDIHTLAKQMGTSVRMLELHYSKLTATMAAERLA